MKQINYSSVICSIILGTSVIIGSLLIRGDHESSSYKNLQKVNTQYRPLMSIKETADYLKLSESQIRGIIWSEEKDLNETHTYSGIMFPTIKIGTETYVSKDSLNEWIKEAATQRKQY